MDENNALRDSGRRPGLDGEEEPVDVMKSCPGS